MVRSMLYLIFTNYPSIHLTPLILLGNGKPGAYPRRPEAEGNVDKMPVYHRAQGHWIVWMRPRSHLF